MSGRRTSGTSRRSLGAQVTGSCPLLLHFIGKIAVQKMSGKAPGSPRHPSSRHPRPSECQDGNGNGNFEEINSGNEGATARAKTVTVMVIHPNFKTVTVTVIFG